ncbi:MAG: hypothetical protein U1E15_00115 [Hyphomicrobiales bacterium]
MSNLLSDLVSLLDAFQNWHPPSIVLYTILGFSAVAAYWMTAAQPEGRLISLPLSFIALTLGGLFANFLGSGWHVEEANDVQKAVVFSLGGEVIMAIIILLVWRPQTSVK